MPGLGDDSRAELIAAVEWIVEGPEVWPISVDDPRARRYLLSRFPYWIFDPSWRLRAASRWLLWRTLEP